MTEAPKKSKRDQLEYARRRQPFQGKERLRLVFMAGGLLAAIGIFLWLNSGLKGKVDPELTPPTETVGRIGSDIRFPPIGPDMFVTVRDSSTTDRLILEPDPFALALKMGDQLLAGHLDELGSPELEFEDLEQNAATLRSLAFRVRGEVVDLSFERRSVDGPEETWALLKVDEENHVWFVCQNPPDDLFGLGGNYVVVDGFFYKIYSRTVEDERITAPLLVGREIQPSVRVAEPAVELDYGILADVRDAEFFEQHPVEDVGYWHLMNFVTTLQKDDARIAADFERATPLDRKALEVILEDPSLRRGQPFKIYGRSVKSWNLANDENEIRLNWSSHSFLSKYELGTQYIRLVAPGQGVLDDLNLSSEMLAYFHKMWAYTDGNDQERRVPIFFVAAFEDRELAASPLEGQIVLGFIALFVIMLIGFGWLIRRDRQQAEAAALRLRERRQKTREQRGE